MQKALTVCIFAGAILTAGIYSAEARPEYARKEGKACGYCHLNAGGGGARGFRGEFYGANGLSFDKFEEDREASVAGLATNLEASESRAKVGYVGNISGPAANQIQLASLRGPVLVVFLDASSVDAKIAAKILKRVAVGYGRKVSVIGVVEGDTDAALKLTQELGSQIRIMPDNGKAMKKFGATLGLDLVVVSKEGDSFKLISGFSKGNLNAAIANIGSFGVEAPSADIADAPVSPVHGSKIG